MVCKWKSSEGVILKKASKYVLDTHFGLARIPAEVDPQTWNIRAVADQWSRQRSQDQVCPAT